MKTSTKAALLALALPTAAVSIAPASAAKKDAPAAAAGPTLKVGEKVRSAQAAAIQAFQTARPAADAMSAAINAKRANPGSAATQDPIIASNRAALIAALNSAEAPIAQAEAAATTDDERYVAQELRYRKESIMLSAQTPEDQRAVNLASVNLAPYLDKLLANPSTPQATQASYGFERGRIALIANQYAQAATYLERARAAGSTDPQLNEFLINAKIAQKDYAGAAAAAEPLITSLKAAGQPVPESYYGVIIEQAYRANNGTASTWELRHVADYPSPKNWHDALIRLQTRGATLDLRQRLDVWRLMRAAKALPDEKERRAYAADALEAGASREAVSLIEEIQAGRPATALDPDTRALLVQAQTRVKAATPLATAEASARSGKDAQSALTAGNFYLAAGGYAKAAEMYQLALSRGAPDADAARMSLGIAQALSGDKASAKASFEAVTGNPRKQVAAYWLTWIA